jgi:hypothetical protein
MNKKEQMAAVQEDSWAICHIDKPSEAVKLAALESCPALQKILYESAKAYQKVLSTRKGD